MSRSMTIGNISVTEDGPAFCVAELGSNHQGSIERASQMMHDAKAAGFQACKLQKRDNASLYAWSLYNKEYNSEQAFGRTYGEHREALELDYGSYLTLQDVARKLGIILFATAFDIPSADFLYRLGMPCYKIASGDLKTTPLLKHVASFGKPMLVSTGGSFLDDVKRAYDDIMAVNQNLCIMQCTAAYPAGADHLHLRVIETYLKEFPDIIIGFSDHHARPEMAVAAYALGARVFEKHTTWDRTAKGTDHAFSLEPREQEQFVENLKRVHLAMGSGIKRPLDIETKPIFKMAKSVYAASNLEKGEHLASEGVELKSPAAGMSPWKLPRFIGRRLKRDIGADEPLSSGDLE